MPGLPYFCVTFFGMHQGRLSSPRIAEMIQDGLGPLIEVQNLMTQRHTTAGRLGMLSLQAAGLLQNLQNSLMSSEDDERN